jgi:succinate dehydrogenase/fumarate reductase flavoprotein subunit
VQKFAGFGIETDAKGRIVVREGALATSRSGVFAGGDCVLGPSSLIESVAQGRLAASAMDRHLGGDGNIEEKLLRDGWQTSPYLGADKDFNRRPRILPALLAPVERKGWQEIEHRLADADARAEGARCLKCNLARATAAPVLPPTS